MNIEAIKERNYAVSMGDYSYEFWNAVRGKRHNAGELAKGKSNDSSVYLPLRANSQMTAALQRESVFRSIATIKHMSAADGLVIAKNCQTVGDWTPDNGTYTFSLGDGDYTEYHVDTHKLGMLIKYDENYLTDVGVDIESQLIDTIAKAFAAREDAAYVNGKGDIEPTGILHDTYGAEIGVTTSTIKYEDVAKLYFSVKPEYRKHGVWMMNDETAYYLRTLKDEGGNYIWNHTNDTILGKPVHICNDMPSIGAGNKPIAFGDFSYYWIIIRDDVTVKVLKEIYAHMRQIGYIAREYLDAKLIRPEAIKVIQMT